MSARIGIVTFPGSLDDRDAARAVRLGGAEPVALWHDDAMLKSVDAVFLPGGFSYGDALRCGAIASFSEVMGLVRDAAGRGLPVLGVCNGFQVLCESHLLPGALVRNAHLRYRNRPARLRVESNHGYKMVKWVKSLRWIKDYAEYGDGRGGTREDSALQAFNGRI